MSILIVDDNHDNLYMLECLLKGNGYDVLKATNGVEALDQLRSRGAELVVSDILMPQMDGFQLCREVRGDNELCTIPFIFYTATYTSEEDEKFALSLGADRFVLKPAEPDAFLAIITEVLQHARQKAAEPCIQSLEADDYFRKYSTRLKEKLEDKVEQALESERRYHYLFNSLRDAVIICDLDCLILDANQPALRNIFGYELEDIRGRCATILAVNDSKVFSAQSTADGTPPEALFRRKDDSVFHGELSLTRLSEDNGTHIGNICVIRDVSRQKMLEAQLLQAQKMEAVGRLAGGVAHDFNNKLTVIIGYTELLKRQKPPWDETEKKLDRIMEAATQSRDITRQLLAFSRKEIISPRLVNLNDLIENGCKGLRHLIGEDINVGFSLAPDVWPSRLDPTQVDQIVLNLAINARDAMPHGGNLCFSTRNIHIDQEQCKSIPNALPGDYVQLEISDTGCGMAQETLKHIFEPFFTTKEAGKGTGLGLATIYGIVSQNRGFISVSSKPGCGTSFTIYFPRLTELAESDDDKPALPLSGTASGTIMIVEDDASVRQVTMGMLQSLGYRVIEKSTPEEAIAFCSACNDAIDLILADVVMPGMNGKEMMKRIQTKRPGTPVLFMSGYSSDMANIQGLLEGCGHFVRKPFDIRTLNAKIMSLLYPKKTTSF